MTNLERRLRKLETRSGPSKPVRLVVRYEGCDGLEQGDPQEDVDESDPNTVVLTVRYVDMPRLERCEVDRQAHTKA
jgi:hypothetical protein